MTPLPVSWYRWFFPAAEALVRNLHTSRREQREDRLEWYRLVMERVNPRCEDLGQTFDWIIRSNQEN